MATRRSGPMAKNNLATGGPGKQATMAGLALRGEPADVGKRLNGLSGSRPGKNQASPQPTNARGAPGSFVGKLKRGSMSDVKSTVDAGNTGPDRGKLAIGKSSKPHAGSRKVNKSRTPRGRGVVNPRDMGIAGF